MKARYFSSIDDCPILLFIYISQGKRSVSALCYEGESVELDAENAWNKIYEEFIDAFGVSSEYKHYMRERLQLCQLLKAYYVNGERWQKIMIEIKKHEIKQLEAQMATQESDFHTILGRLSKSMGFGIDPNKTTVRQFYSYIKAL